MQIHATEVSAAYYSPRHGIVSLLMLTITYIQTMLFHIHTEGGFNNHAVHSLYMILVMATSVVSVIKMGNLVPRAGLKPHFWHSGAGVLPLHYVGSLMTPLYPGIPVYAASWLRGQCRLLLVHSAD